jgi:hypothetical protein
MAEESKGSKNKEKSLKEAAFPPLPFEKHIKKTTEKKKVESKSQSKVEPVHASSPADALKKVLELQKNAEELKNKIDEMYQKLGWTVAYTQRYLDSPGNFDQEQLEFIRKERESLMKHFDISEEKRKALRKSYQEGASPARTKSRSTKVAANRRNWIPMR